MDRRSIPSPNEEIEASSPASPTSPRPGKNKWSKEEDEKILHLRNNGLRWGEIAEAMPGRSLQSCRLRAQNYLNIKELMDVEAFNVSRNDRRVKWSEEEDEKLINLRKNGWSWEAIADQMPGRSHESCRLRAEYLTKQDQQDLLDDDEESKASPPTSPLTSPPTSPNKRKIQWSKEEDDKILNLRNNGWTWDAVAAEMPGRSGRSCRLRAQNYLFGKDLLGDEGLNLQLAKAYARKKQAFWEDIGRDLNRPWQIVEQMHWQMGKWDMEELAGEEEPSSGSFIPSLPTRPLQLPGVEAMMAGARVNPYAHMDRPPG
ncbi:hypothetical protein AYO21_11813 [Fonsecaea monophora]|uniref:Myb-like domain-containing protein n=1 Tax=Fonsecaea monophora TaxID=254056 RepID=A0A177EPW8_9EURO|nr:hypothetical protein AYO21_11813 [Fonsecaea monophora]OAG34045.1 hypothetical protein AYO21_11813 [Fonsecaea monophora]